jgi:hypothetical protein
MSQQCFAWEEALFAWEDNPYTWDDVCFALELLAGHGDFYQWDEQKQQKFLTFLAKFPNSYRPGLQAASCT